MQLPDQYQCTHLETNAQTKRALKSMIIEVRVCLVSCSHFADPKIVDPANVWDLPIKFFLALEV